MALKKHVALRFMQTFQCVGSDCEDTCCHRWAVDIDQGHFVKLKRLLEREPGGRERFERDFKMREASSRTRHRFARVQFDEHNNCPFLNQQGLCDLHSKFGERVLPDICAHYPRVANIVGERLELAAELSCPEVVRGCLLHEGAADLVDIENYGGRPLYHHQYSKFQEDAYRGFLDEVRGTFYWIAGRGEYSLAARLFFAAYFAERTVDHFFDGSESFDEARLRADLDEIGAPALHELLNGRMRAQPVAGPEAISLVAQLLAVQTLMESSPKFRELVRAALNGYAERGEGVTKDGDLEMSLSLETFWNAYHSRRTRIESLIGDRVERYFENYAKHYFIRHWYTDSKNLFIYVQNLLLRIAVLRFLLLSHPYLDGIEAMDEAARADAADRAVVEVVYSFSRSVDHFEFFLQKLDKVVASQLTGLIHSALLLAV